MNVPFLDLQAAYRELQAEIDAATKRVLDSGRYVGGEELTEFEQEWASYCGSQACIGVGSGLDALSLTLRAWGIGAGDEVIVPTHTFIATWLAVSHVGATPVAVPVSPEHYTLAPEAIEAAITPRTRAIIPVHLYGHAANLAPILDIAARHGLKVLEDAAQAHGARYRGERIGAHGDAVAWSFYPGKNLGAQGDGGAITTNDKALAERLRALGNYGSLVKYEHRLCGYNSRLDTIQAAILRVKLKRLDDWNLRRRTIAQHYLEHLAGGTWLLPQVAPWAEPVWHLFVIRHPRRNELRRHLATWKVETLIHYPIPIHEQDAYQQHSWRLSGTDGQSSLNCELLSLPIGPHLGLEAADRVAAAFRAFA